MADLVPIPTISGAVAQDFVVERLGGSREVFYYLDGFVEEIWNKSPDSNLYKLMRTLLGDTGVNALKRNYLQARLLLDELGIDLFDLDAFYGNPIRFGRILEERFQEDPTGLITHDQWVSIKQKNASYRNRAQDYVSGVRAGNTPEGIRLVAKSGLGHDVTIVENYKYLFDLHSDTPGRLPYYGKTQASDEFIVLPNPEIGQSSVQTISIFGTPSPPNGGTFDLVFNGQSTYDYAGALPYNASSATVRTALESLPQIGRGNVAVAGGPGPNYPWTITFQGTLGHRLVPELVVVNSLTYFNGQALDPSNVINIVVATVQSGTEANKESIRLPDRDARDLQSAIDFVRPQNSLPTIGQFQTQAIRGTRSRTKWKSAIASSEFSEVQTYVTGNSQIVWPEPSASNIFWIDPTTENQAPRAYDDISHHYQNFHNVQATMVSSDSVPGVQFPITGALAAVPEPLFVTTQVDPVTDVRTGMIDGIYPMDYATLPGAPPIASPTTHWESIIGSGTEYLQVILDAPKAVNYISFEILRRPVKIDINYDTYDLATNVNFVPVKPIQPYTNELSGTNDDSWASLGLAFTNSLDQMIYTRKLRLTLTRTSGYVGQISIRNLRVARNIA